MLLNTLRMTGFSIFLLMALTVAITFSIFAESASNVSGVTPSNSFHFPSDVVAYSKEYKNC